MRKLIAVACTAALVLIIGTPADGTPATRMAFEGFIHFCVGNPPHELKVTPGGTVRLKATNQNLWAVNNPLIDGIETNVTSVNLNPSGGNVYLDVTLEPFAVDGTWEITQTIQVQKDGTAIGHGVGHGTGDILGMTIKYTAGPTLIVPNPCSDFPSAVISGVIILPN